MVSTLLTCRTTPGRHTKRLRRVAGTLASLALMLAVVSLQSCADNAVDAKPVKTVPSVDLQRYSGTWYEIASFPMFFQRQCIGNTQANYEIERDGTVKVHNQCRTKDGTDAVDGIAELVPDTGGAKLRVAFFRPFWADYWIVGLDPAYRWAVVGNPSRKNLWILSRTKVLAPELLKEAKEAAATQGYDLARLRYTPQD